MTTKKPEIDEFEKQALKVFSRMNQRNLTRDERREIIGDALRAAHEEGRTECERLRAALQAIAAPTPEHMMPDIGAHDEAEMLVLALRRRRDMARETLKPKGEMK